MSRNLRQFTKALYGFDAVVQRVSDDAWDQPSPCEGWTARDVVAHQAGGLTMVAGFLGTEVAMPDMADPKTAWAEVRDAVLEAVDDPDALETVAATPFGEMPVDRFLRIYSIDPVTHAWDLAMATGQPATLHPELVEAGITQLTKAGDSIRGDGFFGPAAPCGDDADPLTRFIAIAGRTWP